MERLNIGEIGPEAAAAQAAAVMRAGGIVLYPTDTVYGLGVDATNENALSRLKALKGREGSKPISVIVADAASIEKYAVMNEGARVFARSHLPGPLTLVLPLRDTTFASIAKDDTLGFRIPDDVFCLALARKFSAPFTTTSANVAGAETESSVDAILAQFGSAADAIDLIIDAGPLPPHPPSTVVSFASYTPHILREGALSKKELGL